MVVIARDGKGEIRERERERERYRGHGAVSCDKGRKDASKDKGDVPEMVHEVRERAKRMP